MKSKMLVSIVSMIAVAVMVFSGCGVSTKCAAGKKSGVVDANLDWAAFLKRHDLVWETLPQRFDHGIYHGNGMLGCMMFQDAANRFRWEMGRSDVTEHRRDNARLPIGGMGLETVGKITNGTARLDLWNAESNGEILTEKGSIKFRTFIHSIEMVAIVDVECVGDEKDAKFSWLAAEAVDRRNQQMKKLGDPPNPPPRMETCGDISVCIQPRYAGGEFATAWKEVNIGPNRRRMYISFADKFPGKGAGEEAAKCVKKAVGFDVDKLLASHREWWHAYYPKSFLSVPDMKVEGFYWIQMYKLACATRSDRMVMDLLGPWYRSTGWPRIWWNLNIQVCYLPVYAANHLELGESLVKLFDNKRANFERNAKEIWKFDDCATVPHTTDYEGLRGDGTCAPDHYINPGDFTWALHNYWMHYRFSMDEGIVTDQKKHAFYPLLKKSINLYLHLLQKGDDGKLHLPTMHSPEYGNAKDNNYNLSLLRWGCMTLIELNRRYKLNDPKLPEWENVLKNLVEYPKDDNGLRIGGDVAFEHSHRHWSHMLMVWPLHIMNMDQPDNRALLTKSLDHWLTVEGGRGINGWSRAAASCLCSTMGRGDDALVNLYKHHDDKRFVMPNAMYIEGSPVIECAFVAAKSLQDMLLQSWGNQKTESRRQNPEAGYVSTIRVFPAVPAVWKDVVFNDLRTEGAFLVSAERKDGKTRWVRIRSLAGEPCRVKPSLQGNVKAVSAKGTAQEVEVVGDGVYQIDLKKGEEVVLYSGDVVPGMIVRPVSGDPETCNAWGVKVPKKSKPALSSGKPAKASSIWSREYDADKAFDGDDESRWGAKAESRSGWLEVDLGSEQMVGQAEIIETFKRTEDFAIEYKAGEAWKELYRGSTIEPGKVIQFTPARARHVRLNIFKANEVPTIEEFRILPPSAGK
jgi:hypothetical protein